MPAPNLQRMVRALHKRMSQEEIARRCECSANAIQLIRTGQTRSPRWHLANRIVDLYNAELGK